MTRLVQHLRQGGIALALAYAPLHALCVWLGFATTPEGQQTPALWLASGLLGAVVCSSAPRAWVWLLPAATLTEFLARTLSGAGSVEADSAAIAYALLALTTTAEAAIGGGLFRMWMEARRPPPTEIVVRGLFVLVAVAVVGGAAREEIVRRLLVAEEMPIGTPWAASLLGALAVAPLALAIGFNSRGHAGRSDGSRREMLLALFATFGIAGYVFSSATSPGQISTIYLLFPPLAWIAARFRPRVTFVTSAALCIVVSLLHARGFGPFAAATAATEPETLGMQGFVIMLLATALIVTMTRHEFRLLQLRRLESTRRLYAAEDAGRLAAGIHLHDGVGQTLTALSLSIRNLLRSPQLNRELADRLDRCQRLVAEAHTSTRRLLAELHPPGLKDLGLAAAIESLLERIESQHHIRVSFERSDAIDPLPMPRRQLLYRCASELLENVVRHAHVDRAALALREAHGTIELEVRDQGSGWDTATWLSSYASGAPSLFGLKDQIELHGGRIEVVSSPGHGCCVRVSLPPAGN